MTCWCVLTVQSHDRTLHSTPGDPLTNDTPMAAKNHHLVVMHLLLLRCYFSVNIEIMLKSWPAFSRVGSLNEDQGTAYAGPVVLREKVLF